MAVSPSPGDSRKNLLRFFRYLRPYRRTLLFSTVVGVLKYNLPVAFPWILKDVIDHLLSGKESRLGLGFDGLMALSLVLFLVYAAITHLRTTISDRLAQRMILDVRSDLFRHLQVLPLAFFQDRQTGAIASRVITDIAMAQNFVGLAGTNVFMDLTSLLAITAVVFSMNWKLALVAFSTLPLYLLVHRRLAVRMRRNAAVSRARMEALEGALHENLSGIAEVKSFTREEEETRRFVERGRRYLESALENIRAHALSLGLTALLTRVPAVLVLWAGGHLVLRGEMTVGVLMAFYAYLEMVYNPLNRLSELNIQLANSRAAIDRLFEVFDQEPESPGGPTALEVREGRIRFSGVAFGYRPEQPVLKGLDLSVEPGERVALVGQSGAGKSTMIKLLLRFHDPWEGRIEVDGQDIREVSLRSLRSRIGCVQQDLILFSGSVEDNLRMGRPEAGRDDILRAAEMANAASFIERLSRGLDTEIGERGVRLSGGEKQRLAIARAFLKDAPLLVLDESTSNLDAPSEHLVYEALERLMAGRTTIIIAHRLSTVARADRVVVVDQGRIAQEGAHADLARDRSGLYSRLYRLHLKPPLEPLTGAHAPGSHDSPVSDGFPPPAGGG